MRFNRPFIGSVILLCMVGTLLASQPYVPITGPAISEDSIQIWPHVWAHHPNAPIGQDVQVSVMQATDLDAAAFQNNSTTCGINEALAALPNAAQVGGTVHFHGFCTTATQLVIRGSGGSPDHVSLIGDGDGSSTINYTGTGATGVIAVGAATFDSRGIVIKGLNISCNGALACIGINAIRTKNMVINHVLFDNSGAGSSGNTAACVVSDGSMTSTAFSSFNDFHDNRCVNGFLDGFVIKGSGSNEASNNNGTYYNNEFTQLNNLTGTAYDLQTGSENVIMSGDIAGYATGYHIVGRGNIILGQVETSNTTCINFDNAPFSAAQFNTAILYAATCPITDTGINNLVMSPQNGLKIGPVGWSTGAGVPATNTCTAANGGSLYSRTDGSTTTTLYVCDNSTHTWSPK